MRIMVVTCSAANCGYYVPLKRIWIHVTQSFDFFLERGIIRTGSSTNLNIGKKRLQRIMGHCVRKRNISRYSVLDQRGYRQNTILV